MKIVCDGLVVDISPQHVVDWWRYSMPEDRELFLKLLGERTNGHACYCVSDATWYIHPSEPEELE
jgi:hypothetical protein